ncbi:porin [Pararhodospirillum photometricum]|uniref:Porin 39 (Por39)b n=1 Tax=Pararhodospirillum photometricum DSM 122 TaxID=1150469 RepID=H6SPN2_PARPM|nr:porin [Pararhodospirillum photometricum]CCG09557.1 Porin 39 (Por39)b [Pararhodospirillum photometricum DSM 122]
MKKILFGTTTLVAVGLLAGGASAADKIKLSLGGKQEVYFGGFGTFEDGGVKNSDGFGMDTDTEVYVKGSTKLDNGLTVSALIQFESEANENGGRNVDEQHIDVSGAFGKLVLGERYGVFADGLRAPNVGEVSPDDTISIWLLNNGNSGAHYGLDTTLDDDSLRVSYYTPAFYGFSAGMSYAPKPNQPGIGSRSGASVPTGEYFRDEVQAAVSYDNTFGGVGLKADGSFITDLAKDESWAYRGGLAVSYAGFEVGGSYMGLTSDNTKNAERSVWEAGASYATGPYAVSFTYAQSDANISATSYILGGAYEMGPGVKVVGNVFYGNVDDDTAANTYRSGAGAVTGMVLSF